MRSGRAHLPLALALMVLSGLAPYADTAPPPGAGQEVDDVLEGFDDEAEAVDETPAESETSRFRLGGLFRLGMSYNFAHRAPAPGRTDWRGLSRLRPELRLDAGARLSNDWRLFASIQGSYDLAYSINGRTDYTPQVLDAYESEIELRDTFLSGSPDRRVDLTFGRQIVAWGTSETVRVTDILNPLDLREPGITDIEDLRLPVAMTRADVRTGRWSLTGIAIHEIRFHKIPVYDHDFYPVPVPVPEAVEPAHTLANTELAASARGAFSGWDLSFYWANVYDDNPHLELSPTGVVELKHSRLTMLGAAWDMAVGDFIVKAEGAHFRGLEFFAAPDRTFSRSELLAGLEYFGFADTSITVEAVVRRLHGYVDDLGRLPDQANEREFDLVFRFTRFLLHQTLAVSLVGVTFGERAQDGAFQRLEARYDITDRLEITGGVVFYRSGDRAGLTNIDDNDRLFLDLAYRF